MKHTEGYWEKNERAHALYVTCACEAQETETGMRVLGAFKPVRGRADQLDTGVLVMEFSAAGEDIIEVTYTHFQGYEKNDPLFELRKNICKPNVRISGNEAVMENGELAVRVGLKDFYIRFERKGKLLTASSFKNVGYMRYNRGYSTKFPGAEYMAETGEPHVFSELFLTAGTNVPLL